MKFRLRMILVALLFCASPLFAQESAQEVSPKPAAGRITGRVLLKDSGAPARFARVTVYRLDAPVESETAESDDDSSSEEPAEAKPEGSAEALIEGGSVYADRFGEFSLSLPPGEYLVTARLRGYLSGYITYSPNDTTRGRNFRTLAEDRVARVTVASGVEERAELTMERGAALSGRLVDSSGVPISSAILQPMRRNADGQWRSQTDTNEGFLEFPMTDSHGNYRLEGLDEGEWTMVAGVSTGSNPDDGSLVSYAGAKTSEVKSLHLLQGEEVAADDLVYNPKLCHTLSGSLQCGSGETAKSAKIKLQYVSDVLLGGVEAETVAVDGHWKFEDLPDGDYVLKVDAPVRSSADILGDVVSTGANPQQATMPFKGASDIIALHGDKSDVTLEACEAKTKEADKESEAAPAKPEEKERFGAVVGHLRCDGVVTASHATVHLAPDASVTKNGKELDTLTDENGDFRFPHVALGEYFVSAMTPYCVFADYQFVQSNATPAAPSMMRIERARYTTHVQVAEDDESRADLSLPHGAAIRGHIYYEDGSPVIDQSVALMRRTPNGVWMSNESVIGYSTTNDLGEYYFEGMPAGVYALQISLLRGIRLPFVQHNDNERITYYSGGGHSMRRAKAIVLQEGEHRDDYDVRLKLKDLLDVRLRVIDCKGHPADMNYLTVEEIESGLQIIEKPAAIGEFMLHALPPGEYRVRTWAAFDAAHRIDSNSGAEQQFTIKVTPETQEVVLRMREACVKSKKL